MARSTSRRPPRLTQPKADSQELRRSNDELYSRISALQTELRSANEERNSAEDELTAVRRRLEHAERDLEGMEGKLDMASLKHAVTEENRRLDQKLLHMERVENTRIRQEALEVVLHAGAQPPNSDPQPVPHSAHRLEKERMSISWTPMITLGHPVLPNWAELVGAVLACAAPMGANGYMCSWPFLAVASAVMMWALRQRPQMRVPSPRSWHGR